MFPDRCGQSVLHIGLPHVQTVALADLPQHLGGNPGSNAVGRNIAGHYRTGGDDAARPDGHTAAHRHTGAQPAVVPDGDGLGILQLVAAVGIVRIGPLLRHERVVGRGQRYVGANEDVIPQRDGCHVQKHAVVVDEAVPSHVDVHTVFAVKGRESLEIFPFRRGDQPLQRPLLGLGAPQGNAVESVAAEHARAVPLGDLRIGGAVEPSRYHALPFTDVRFRGQRLLQLLSQRIGPLQIVPAQIGGGGGITRI